MKALLLSALFFPCVSSQNNAFSPSAPWSAQGPSLFPYVSSSTGASSSVANPAFASPAPNPSSTIPYQANPSLTTPYQAAAQQPGSMPYQSASAGTFPGSPLFPTGTLSQPSSQSNPQIPYSSAAGPSATPYQQSNPTIPYQQTNPTVPYQPQPNPFQTNPAVPFQSNPYQPSSTTPYQPASALPYQPSSAAPQPAVLPYQPSSKQPNPSTPTVPYSPNPVVSNPVVSNPATPTPFVQPNPNAPQPKASNPYQPQPTVTEPAAVPVVTPREIPRNPATELFNPRQRQQEMRRGRPQQPLRRRSPQQIAQEERMRQQEQQRLRQEQQKQQQLQREQQMLKEQQAKEQQLLVRSAPPTMPPQRAPTFLPPTVQRLAPTMPPQRPVPLVLTGAPTAAIQTSYGPPPPLSLQSRVAIPVGPRPSAVSTSLYGSAVPYSSPTPGAGSATVDAACVTCVCGNWNKCCLMEWTSFCDGLTATVCSAQCPGQYSGTQNLQSIRSYPGSVGEFCGRGIFMRPLDCDVAQGLQCLASSNEKTTKAEIGLCFQVTPPPPASPLVCTDATPRCSCTVENCGGTRGWNGVQGVCQAGEHTSAFEMQNCQVTPQMCSTTEDKCECAFSSCWGWTSLTSQCVIAPECVDRRNRLADAAVQGFKARNIQVLAWDFDSTIVAIDTAAGTYPDLNYISDRMDLDFLALSKAAMRAGMKQAITSYNSIGMVFIDGQLTGGPALLKALLAKVLGEDNNFLIYAFESQKPTIEGKNVHLEMLMQQLRITHKSTVLLIDDYEMNVDLAKEAGFSTAKARTGRGVDLRMLAT